ncbi:hypothetical protein [Tsuneonella mangrovi]|uniref:hypothetical protein n=1 Tax=Tsuneonella mangrovi TaxID=1982042 RepID=UPI00196A4D1C|nr:hypothetical protein [Tsuneonella mangrovi]
MAHKGIGFFDNRGQFFKVPEDAALSDLCALLGKIGEGDSLAPGIAHLMLEKRVEIERIFAELDQMRESVTLADSNVTPIDGKRDRLIS